MVLFMANFNRLLQRLVAPGVEGSNARRNLTRGMDVTFRYNQDLQLTIVADGLVAHLKNCESILASTPFVPWDSSDDLYEEKLLKDTLLDDEAFLDSYFGRFQCNEK